MQERSLKIYNTDKTFFMKITNTLNKLLIPTRVGLNGIVITLKRNNVVKAYCNYKEETVVQESNKENTFSEKYEETYTLYLEAIDKYIMDSLYKKVKNNTAQEFEKAALSTYYTITSLKETQYAEYKLMKQKYLLELDYESVSAQKKRSIPEKYENFYIDRADSLYKGLLKNYAIQITDNISKFEDKNSIYESIFSTIEEYVNKILPKKITKNKEKYKDIVQDYDKYEEYQTGKLSKEDKIEKNMLLLGMSRTIFTHSLPLATAESCYQKLIADARKTIENASNEAKQEITFNLLFKLMLDYSGKLLSTKVYWDKPEDKKNYKGFESKLSNTENTSKQRDILLIKTDLKQIYNQKENYSKLIKIYKQKLVELGGMKELGGKAKTLEKFLGRKVSLSSTKG
ncbi:MAG: hypothetical protein LBL91_05125 [Lachnospiraceae bacterium]|nr:hypothetical protein [Lachnospiraceae bacterium]